jgi:hypothetical protein
LVREDWTRGLDSSFVPFGNPRPHVAEHAELGRAFFVNGDGSFSSGGYSRAAIPSSAGFGLEAFVSTPLEMTQWQSLSIHFFTSRADERLRKWDHAYGYPPLWDPAVEPAVCYTIVPGDEGPGALREWSIQNGTRIVAPLPPARRTGRPWRLTVQMFPDGSCGAAMDGQPVFWVAAGKPPAVSYRIGIYGSSYKTSVAVGPLEIFTGVKPGIDWTKATYRSDSLRADSARE